jgi:Htaa
MRKIAIAVALAAVALVAVPVAAAAPVTGGKSVLKPDVATFEGFADMSMSVGATGAAEDKRRGVNFPISGGDIADNGQGSVQHRGGLVFARNTAEGGVVKFSKFFVVVTANKAKLFAKSDHAEVRFLDLDLTDVTIGGTPGVKFKLKDVPATLAKQAAQVMSEEFDFPFRKGIPMGTLTIKATLSS